jgi:hypothetical protein
LNHDDYGSRPLKKDLDDLIQKTRSLLDVAETIAKLPEDKWDDRVQQLPFDQRQRVKNILQLIKRECR